MEASKLQEIYLNTNLSAIITQQVAGRKRHRRNKPGPTKRFIAIL